MNTKTSFYSEFPCLWQVIWLPLPFDNPLPLLPPIDIEIFHVDVRVFIANQIIMLVVCEGKIL
jgi:hypothetical protein